MSDDYWEKAYENGEYKHWEFNYPSPELTALVAANVFPKKRKFLMLAQAADLTQSFLQNVVSRSQALISALQH